MGLTLKLVVCNAAFCLGMSSTAIGFSASAPEMTRASVGRVDAGRGSQLVETPKVVGSLVTSGVSLAQGKRVAVQSFSQQDFIVSLVDFQSARLAESGGNHLVEWRWYLGDKLVSHSKKGLSIAATPSTVRSMRAASALGAGRFKVETLIDGILASSTNFEIDSY